MPQPGGEPVPHISIKDREECTTCGQIRSQRDEVQKSIKVEKEQLQQQVLQRQQQQIDQFQAMEQSGQQYTDQQLTQQIQDKIDLLEQLNEELAAAQNQGQPAPVTAPMPSGQVPQVPAAAPLGKSLVEISKDNFAKFLQTVKTEATCAATISKLFKIPPPVAYAICVGATELLGDAQKLEQYADQLYDYLTGQGQPVPTKSLPPPHQHDQPQPVRVCMLCDSTESAIRWQAGESGPGCHVESVSNALPEPY